MIIKNISSFLYVYYFFCLLFKNYLNFLRFIENDDNFELFDYKIV